MAYNKGSQIEELVAAELANNGHKVLARNYRTKLGEIDIIYREKGTSTLVFAEVKYRKNNRHGNPYEYVDARKLRKIYRAIHYYLQEHGISYDVAMRVDVISVLGDGSVKHFKAVNMEDL